MSARTSSHQSETSDDSIYPTGDDQDRWVVRRTQFLTRTHDLRPPVARSVAWLELGYSTGGAANKMDRTESTIKNYFDDLEDQFGYAVGESRTEFSIDLKLTELPPRVSPVCPECNAEQVVSTAEAERIFNDPSEDTQAAIDHSEVTHVCTGCGALLIPRPEEVDQ